MMTRIRFCEVAAPKVVEKAIVATSGGRFIAVATLTPEADGDPLAVAHDELEGMPLSTRHQGGSLAKPRTFLANFDQLSLLSRREQYGFVIW